MAKYIDAERLLAEIDRQEIGYNIDGKHAAEYDTCVKIVRLIEQIQKEQPVKVYRVENEKEQKGLWRKFDGTWEPLFDMLTDGQCKDMPMDDSPIYREGGKQWFASAPSKETLQKWFSKRDLEELTAKGFTISEFEVIGHKKVSDFEYIFTRDSIISRKYLKVSDIYPQVQPEVDLEKEIDRFEDWMETYNQADYPTSFTTRDIARHFYDLGCRRTAEMYDEIEYNRQRAEESEKPMNQDGLEEEAVSYCFDNGLNLSPRVATDFAIHLAEWQKEQDDKELSEKIAAAYQLGLADKEKQMMKEAVEGEVYLYRGYKREATVILTDIPKDKLGDKVRIIIVKED